MGRPFFRVVTGEDHAEAEARQQALAERLAAIEEWVNYFFDRPEQHDGKYPKVARERFPKIAKVLLAYLKVMAEEVTFTPRQYQALCTWFYDEWFLERALKLGLQDALLPNFKRAWKIVKDQDEEALKTWFKQLTRRHERYAVNYDHHADRLREQLTVMGVHPASTDWIMALEAFQLLWLMVCTPDKRSNVAPPSEDGSAQDSNTPPLTRGQDCPGWGGLRLVKG